MKNLKTYIFPKTGFLILVVVLFSSARNFTSDDLLIAGSKISLTSTDTLLVSIFDWARKTSEDYTGSDNDPVGPWYEAALPKREAFCIRDVSHQCISAEILGFSKQNLNMFHKFAVNISEKKDYCSFWEINRYNKPAPVDYANDNDFWYNLNANFDIIDACYKLFLWTGDSIYILDKVFDDFFRLTLNQYIERWQLQADRIMERPSIMNLKPETVRYRLARGIPSYDEAQDNMIMSSDLLGMIYNGFRTYSTILDLRNETELSALYLKKADKYLHLIDSAWWDESSGSYYSFCNTEKKFYTGGAGKNEFLLWYNVIKAPGRIVKSLLDLSNSQVEVLSYLPMLFYRYGFNEEGYDFLEKIYKDKRRSYPEASSGAIEGIVRGLMGVEPSAADGVIATCPRLSPNTAWVCIENIPVFSGLISVRHDSFRKSVFANKSNKPVIWRAAFQGSFNQILIDGKVRPAQHFSDPVGKIHSYVEVTAGPKSQMSAEAVS